MKSILPTQQERIDAQLALVLPELLKLLGNMEKVIFIDEVTFSSHTRKQQTWSVPREKFIVEKECVHFPVVACVGAIDETG